MKKILSFLAAAFLFLAAQTGQAQTVVQQGGLVIIQWNVKTTTSGQVAFVARQNIASGTVVYFTNGSWNETTKLFTNVKSGNGIIRIEFNEDVSFGQVIKVNWNSGAFNSTTGKISAVFHTNGVFDFKTQDQVLNKFYVYQSTNGGTNLASSADGYIGKVVSATFYNYNNKDVDHTLPPGVVLQDNSHKNATNNNYTATVDNASGSFTTGYNWNANGASAQCSCWSPYLNATASIGSQNYLSSITITNELLNLTSTFFKPSSWVGNNGTLISMDGPTGGTISVDPCDPMTGVFDYLTNPNNIVYQKYRWGNFVGNESPSSTTQSGSTPIWQGLPATGNWQNVAPTNFQEFTQDKEVQFYKDYTFGSFNAAAPSTLSIEFGKIFIYGNNTTVTLDAGVSIKVHTSVAMDNGSKMVLNSKRGQDKKTYYAQIAPSAATLNGTYSYKLTVTSPGWHHLYSPISTTLGAVTSSDPDFSFVYSGGAIGTGLGNVNVYRWNASATGDSNWVPATSTLNPSASPITVLFQSNQVPTVLTFTGTMAHPDQNTESRKSAGYSAPTKSSAGYYSGWASQNKSGWNMYGNPHISFMDVASYRTNYLDNKTGEALNSTVYVWAPRSGNNLNVGTNYYNFNGTGGNADSAGTVAPFQAFFMQNTLGSASNNGLVVGKKYRKTTGVALLKKTSSPEFSLELLAANGQSQINRVYLDPTSDLTSLQSVPTTDGSFLGDPTTGAVGIVYNQSLYSIKTIPSIVDSTMHHVDVISNNHGQQYALKKPDNFNEGYESFVYDRKLGILHNLSYSNYTFNQDTTFGQYRFEWFVVSNGLSLDETKLKPATYWFTQNDALRIGGSMATDAPASLALYTWDGRKAATAEGRGNEVAIPMAGLAKGPYVMIVNGKTALKVVVQ